LIKIPFKMILEQQKLIIKSNNTRQALA